MKFFKDPISKNITKSSLTPKGFTKQRFVDGEGNILPLSLALEQEQYELENGLPITISSVADEYEWVEISEDEYFNTIYKNSPKTKARNIKLPTKNKA